MFRITVFRQVPTFLLNDSAHTNVVVAAALTKVMLFGRRKYCSHLVQEGIVIPETLSFTT